MGLALATLHNLLTFIVKYFCFALQVPWNTPGTDEISIIWYISGEIGTWFFITNIG